MLYLQQLCNNCVCLKEIEWKDKDLEINKFEVIPANLLTVIKLSVPCNYASSTQNIELRGRFH